MKAKFLPCEVLYRFHCLWNHNTIQLCVKLYKSIQAKGQSKDEFAVSYFEIKTNQDGI